jgi:hypothetical protein
MRKLQTMGAVMCLVLSVTASVLMASAHVKIAPLPRDLLNPAKGFEVASKWHR